jgi:hypothetical protein
MTEAKRSTPPPTTDRTEKTIWELPGVFKVGLVTESEPAQSSAKPAPTQEGGLLLTAVIAAVMLCGLFTAIGRRKRRKP